MVAASPVGAGQEIHNTYGELSNCELVQKVRTPRSACAPACRLTLAPENLRRNDVSCLHESRKSACLDMCLSALRYRMLPQTNAVLLDAQYGFAVAGNPFDSVALPLPALTEAAEQQLGARTTAKRVAFLNEHRCSPPRTLFHDPAHNGWGYALQLL